MDPKYNPLADRGWYSVAGDAEVLPNVYPGGRRDDQRVAVDRGDQAALIPDHFVVLAFPHNLRPRGASGLARHVDGTALLDHDIRGSAGIDDGGRDDDLEKTPFAPHGVGVDLTHVPASIRLLYIVEMQPPDFVVVV